MIDRGADDRKTNGHIHPTVEPDQFKRDMALIMVHGNKGIEFTKLMPMEECIGREGTACPDPLSIGDLDRRRDLFDFLSTEPPVFAGVRVEAGDANPFLP